jgi:hypothetical protein
VHIRTRGATEPTVPQRALISKIAWIELRCSFLDRKLGVNRETHYDQDTYLAHTGKLMHLYGRLGLGPASQVVRGADEEVTPRPDPVNLMLQIAQRFMDQAAELDDRVAKAIDTDASHADIVSLMNLAATDRLRALSACQAAAPFCSPKLAAIEVAPATPLTRSRFEQRLADMSEEEVLEHVKLIAAGKLTLDIVDGDGGEGDDEAR